VLSSLRLRVVGGVLKTASGCLVLMTKQPDT
jgi:hypothetical protein